MSIEPTKFQDTAVAAAFEAFQGDVAAHLMQLRELIFLVADETSVVGPLSETLKWGQPSYMPVRPRVGSPIRLGIPRNTTSQYAMFFHCQTTLVEEFQELYPTDFKFQGNRVLILDSNQLLATDQLKHCIAKALTYHLKTKQG